MASNVTEQKVQEISPIHSMAVYEPKAPSQDEIRAVEMLWSAVVVSLDIRNAAEKAQSYRRIPKCDQHLAETVLGYEQYYRYTSALDPSDDYSYRVKTLTLSGMPMSEIPLLVSDFDALEELHLDQMGLTKFPNEFQTANIHTLTLQGNKIEQLDINLADFPKLKILDLRDNPLKQLPVGCQTIPTVRLEGTPFASLVKVSNADTLD